MKQRKFVLGGLIVGVAALGLAAGLRWHRTAPERHLREALRLLDSPEPALAQSWLGLPEAARATRDRALIARARLALALGRPNDAVKPLDAIAANSPSSVDADYWRGRTLIAMKSQKLAITWFRRVLSRRANDLEARRWLAAAAYDLGDWPTAVKTLEGVTRLQPDDYRAWRTLGSLFKEEGEWARAIAAYRASLKFDPKQKETRFELAQVFFRSGQYLDAERELRDSRGQVDESKRLDLVVQCLRSRGDRDAAKTLLGKALITFPDHPGLLAQRALIAQAEGNFSLALKCLDRAMETEPDNAQYLYQRGRVLRLLDRPEESDRDLAKAAALNRDLATMADLNTQAIEHPHDPAVRSRLGQLCVRLGMPELAGYWYRAALACDPDFADARAGLQSLQLR